MMKYIFQFHFVSVILLYFSPFCRLKLNRLKSFQLRFGCDRLPVYVSDNLTENVKCILTAECSINVFLYIHLLDNNSSFDQQQPKVREKK